MVPANDPVDVPVVVRDIRMGRRDSDRKDRRISGDSQIAYRGGHQIYQNMVEAVSRVQSGTDSGIQISRLGGGMMEDLRERIADLIERQDQLTELEYMQEKNIILQDMLNEISQILDAYDMIVKTIK